jgi:hypothetical protein
MKKVVTELTDWLGTFVELLKVLLVLGIVIGILFEDYFGVIGNLGVIMTNLGQQGLAGLVALGLLATWYKPSKYALRPRQRLLGPLVGEERGPGAHDHARRRGLHKRRIRPAPRGRRQRLLEHRFRAERRLLRLDVVQGRL